MPRNLHASFTPAEFHEISRDLIYCTTEFPWRREEFPRDVTDWGSPRAGDVTQGARDVGPVAAAAASRSELSMLDRVDRLDTLTWWCSSWWWRRWWCCFDGDNCCCWCWRPTLSGAAASSSLSSSCDALVTFVSMLISMCSRRDVMAACGDHAPYSRPTVCIHQMNRVNSRNVTGNDSVPKIAVNDAISIFFLNCNQHFGNFKPFPSAFSGNCFRIFYLKNIY